MEIIVKEFMNHPLNGSDMLSICNNEANLLLNRDLKNYSNIDAVMGSYKACILLYENKDSDVGHWCCFFKVNENKIEFFDSYGLSPDDALDITGGFPYLTNLFNKSGYKIVVNKFPLQKYKDNVSTCGRYCGLRILMRNIKLRDFIALFTKNKCYDSDFWCVLLTLFCEN